MQADRALPPATDSTPHCLQAALGATPLPAVLEHWQLIAFGTELLLKQSTKPARGMTSWQLASRPEKAGRMGLAGRPPSGPSCTLLVVRSSSVSGCARLPSIYSCMEALKWAISVKHALCTHQAGCIAPSGHHAERIQTRICAAERGSQPLHFAGDLLLQILHFWLGAFSLI